MGDYAKTLNLPETGFPMRGNLAKREPGMLARNQASGLYRRMREANAGRPPFVLHDGPPYANGDIHMGHVVNKCLKDFVTRTKVVLGHDASYIPGWDCHGLPIERELEKQGVSKDDPIAFRTKCRAFADSQIGLQRAGFERLGVLGDWDNHYRTMRPETEGKIIQALGALRRTGLVYRGLRPVLHCTDCMSSLAEAEIEYAERVSQAVDVAFTAVDPAAVAQAFGMDSAGPVAAVIWTTTPWTLPANQCLVANAELGYVWLQCAGQAYVVARELVEACLGRWGKAGEVRKEVKGAALEGLGFRHPFYDRIAPLHLAAHATAAEGTGLVHTAPAHGQEDFEVGVAHGLEAKCPVDPAGRYHTWVERFGGMDVWEAVKPIIALMQDNGSLLAHREHAHSYPVCWRHKTPVLFRTSMQWFVAMDQAGPDGTTLRERSVAAIEASEYFPAWGKERMRAMVETRPDWCLSRQRMWNSPVAFFAHKETGELHPRTDEFIERIAAVVTKGGIEAWFAMPKEELLGEEAEDYEKINDTLDVWFDSGVTHQAVMGWQGGDANRPDMYLEGSDQHRGWFMSSLMTGCALHGEPPWRQVLTHGFVVGGDGRKMSKSAGNALSPQRILSQHGADILRLWVAMSDYAQEIKLSEDILKTNIDSYRLLRNRIRFLLANTVDFDHARDAVPVAELAELDRYILVQADWRRIKVREHFDRYAFHHGMQELHELCNIDLGRFYLDIIKDRLYTLPEGCRARRSAQTALHHLTRLLLVGLGPVLSFTADEAWQEFTGDPDGSVMFHTLEPLPVVEDAGLLAERWDCIRSWRARLSKEVDRARGAKEIDCPDVELKVTLTAPAGDHAHLGALSAADLAYVMLVSEVILVQGEAAVRVEQAAPDKCPRCWRRAPGIGAGDDPQVCSRCEQALAGKADDGREA